ncbi:DUF1405 domain-containing protein [Metabacillus fastidiosus]|uniref:DUF1405 domain-containing protein n=1 Tax=Metabacillus fastidiosus TaxID=1458 RepID=UPI002DB71646|nr:DUF1405 domain-containing protein [Metabacillus fastidiosus]MEC2077449.1 DUF1405 domain-containing protein [Metabacillus fastidiosus]
MKMIHYFLGVRPILILLFIINFFGTLYGYYWYKSQLVETPPEFLIFVPDSPTASLFFVIVLGAFIFRKNLPLFEALAIVTLFKYGIWAVVMNLLTLNVMGTLDPQAYMLIASHLGMAIQGILYAPYYRFNIWHLVIAAIWTLHNDVIDYLFEMMPQYRILSDYMNEIGYFTFWLSIVSIFIGYFFVIRKNATKLTLPNE